MMALVGSVIGQGRFIVKGLYSLSAVALAVALGTSTIVLTASNTDAQAQTRVTVFKPGTQQYYESRMKMCNGSVKGIYRTQQDGWVYPYGYCLSDVARKVWN